MIRRAIFIIFIFSFLLTFQTYSQAPAAAPETKNAPQKDGQKKDEQKDEIYSMPIIGFSAAGVLPGGEMGKRYNPFFSFGATFIYKTNQNWLFGADVDFLLGADNLKKDQRNRILQDIMSPEHTVIGITGTDAGVTGELQGISGIAKVGKIFPLTSKNRNSGILLTAGAGYLQQRILFQNTLENAPQIEGDYAKGYDCMTRGFQLREFIGYMFMSNGFRYFNFYVGFEFTQAWSKLARDYSFVERKKDDKSYFDAMYSLKVGWMFPLKSKKAKDFYYF